MINVASSVIGKLGVNMNFRQFLGVICVENLCESGISSPPWNDSFIDNSVLLFCGILQIVLRNSKSSRYRSEIFKIDFRVNNNVVFRAGTLPTL